MVDIKYRITDGGGELTLTGHADYNPGNDIVCAAVSAVFQTAIIGLLHIAAEYPDSVRIKEKEHEHD